MNGKNSLLNTPEERSRQQLEYVLQAKKKLNVHSDEVVELVSVEQSLLSDAVYRDTSGRDITRVLFISRDESLLNPTTQSLDGFLDVSLLFDEVHILLLRTGIPAKNPVLRVAKNVWLYTATAKLWWWTPVAALKLVHEQLVFVGGLRADLVVARDPFESALVAYLIGSKYDRPTQVHVLEDYTKSEWLKQQVNNGWRRYLPRLLLRFFPSIRTVSYGLKERLEKERPLAEVAVLPKYHNYEALVESVQAVDLQAIYKPFTFIILYVGRLGYESSVHHVIDAARHYLQNPRVGLVIVGDGPARKEFVTRVGILGIAKQVVFETRVVDVPAYLKSANVLIVSDLDSDGDEVVLRGAASGIPIIIARNQYRNDIFADGTNALMFSQDNTEELHDKIKLVMNDIGLRRYLTEGATLLIHEKFHEDKDVYRLAYRKSIEKAMFVGEDGIAETVAIDSNAV